MLPYCFFFCAVRVAVTFISKYGIAVFRAQADVCGEFKILCRGSR